MSKHMGVPGRSLVLYIGNLTFRHINLATSVGYAEGGGRVPHSWQSHRHGWGFPPTSLSANLRMLHSQREKTRRLTPSRIAPLRAGHHRLRLDSPRHTCQPLGGDRPHRSGAVVLHPPAPSLLKSPSVGRPGRPPQSLKRTRSQQAPHNHLYCRHRSRLAGERTHITSETPN